MIRFIVLVAGAAILVSLLPMSRAEAHGCHAKPGYDQHGYHRHIRHCLRVALPPPR